MGYADLLRDPRWQKRRLEILEQASFTCQDCGAKDKELHVHHLVYRKGWKPWEYPDDVLLVLCKDCHAEIGRLADELLFRCRNAALLRSLLSVVTYTKGEAFDLQYELNMAGHRGFSEAMRTIIGYARGEAFGADAVAGVDTPDAPFQSKHELQGWNDSVPAQDWEAVRRLFAAGPYPMPFALWQAAAYPEPVTPNEANP